MYITTDQLAKQMSYRDTTNPRLTTVCQAATDAINDWCGIETELTPVPPMIESVALSLAIDLWKQPDATFGIMGLGETGPVRTARDLLARYDAQLIAYYDPLNGWGLA